MELVVSGEIFSMGGVEQEQLMGIIFQKSSVITID